MKKTLHSGRRSARFTMIPALPALGLLAVLVWFALSLPAWSAPHISLTARYVVDQWQTDEGLPQNSVTSIEQTPDGYLWLGTFNGLVRFDGSRFVVFDAESTPELGSSRIVSLKLDGQGRLWILSEFGDATSFAGGRFTSWRGRPGRVSHLVTDLEGRMWLDLPATLERFDLGESILAPENDGTDFGWKREMLRDAGGAFWVLRKRGIGFTRNQQFTYARTLPNASDPVDSFAPSSSGGIWVVLKPAGLMKYRDDGGGTPVLPLPLPGDIAVRSMLEDRHGNVWLGTLAHGLLMRGTNGSWQVFSRTNGLSHDSIRVVSEDLEGNIWVGTDGGGLNRLRPRTFIVHGASAGVALTTTEDGEGRQWIGFNGAPIQFLDQGRMRSFSHPELGVAWDCWSLAADRQGKVWMSDLRGGLVETLGGTYVHHPYEGANPPRFLRAILHDRAGRVWMGHVLGLLCFENGKFTRFGKADGLPSEDIRTLAEDRQGGLFIGSNGGGLARLRDGKVQILGSRPGLAQNHVWSLYVDSEDCVWVGTFGAGLSRFKDGKFFDFGPALPAKVVTGIIEDDFGHFWLGSLKGILRVKRSDLNDYAAGRISELVCQTYDKHDGLESFECSGGLQPSVWKARDGRIWFPTLKGVAVVDPARLSFNSRPPWVNIEETMVDDRPQALAPGGKLRVSPGGTRLEFNFTAMSFASAERVRFKYRLEGLDRDWIDGGSRRTAPYMNVPPGDYWFRVRAGNSDGVWNEPGAVLGVIIVPFFWQTGWFQFSGGVLAVAAVLLVFRRQLNRLHREREVQQTISRRLIESQEMERKRIAGELHDSLGQNLQLIKNHLTGIGARKEAAGVREELEEVGFITSQAISEVRSISYALRPAELEQAGLTLAMQWLVEKVSEASGIQMPAEIDPIDGLLSPEMEINLYRILQECLNNVVKHSQATQVIVEIKREGETLRLSVFDNGRGFEKKTASAATTARPGLGMSSMSERARILGGSWEIQSVPGKGTRVTVIIPGRKLS